MRKGQPLLSIYSPELVSAQEEVLLALKAKKILSASPITDVAEGGDRLLQGARRRLLLWDITPKQLETLEQTGEIKKNMVLYSPVDGFVMEKMAFKGMSIMPGAALFKIGDLSTIWVIADIYEYELPFIKIGDKAQITLAYFPGETFEGTATYIYPSLDPKTRTAKVRFDLPNPEFKLKPEMWANVELKIPLGRKLVVPEDAVMDSGTMQMVFVDRGQGHFESRHIQVGSKVQGYYRSAIWPSGRGKSGHLRQLPHRLREQALRWRDGWHGWASAWKHGKEVTTEGWNIGRWNNGRME